MFRYLGITVLFVCVFGAISCTNTTAEDTIKSPTLEVPTETPKPKPTATPTQTPQGKAEKTLDWCGRGPFHKQTDNYLWEVEIKRNGIWVQSYFTDTKPEYLQLPPGHVGVRLVNYENSAWDKFDGPDDHIWDTEDLSITHQSGPCQESMRILGLYPK